MSPCLPASFLSRLKDEFPADLVSADPGDLREYGRDWTRDHEPAPSLVFFPRTHDEVAGLMRACAAGRVAVVPSGGRTGLSGGAVAAHGEVVLSLRRMADIEPVDTLGGTVHVQAGAITEAVHRHCAPHGLTWPVDFASKGSSQVGGNIATNAGGVRVIRYGMTRRWVLGLRVVTASGETLDLDRGLEKNNTGVDLLHLFIGSEGILGIITAATLKLAPLPRRTDLALVGAPSLAAVLRVFREARWETLTLSAFEVFSDACLARVRRHRGLESPLSQPAPFLALIEVENDHEGRLAGWIDRTMRQGILTDGVMAQSPRQAEELWALRENISESLTATGLPHKNDVSVPVAQLSPFTSDLGELVRTRYAGLEVLVYGHVGDGNLHVNTMKPEEMSPEEFTARTREVDRDLFELVRRHRGSISAEHGIGLLKKDYLSYTRSPAEIDLLKQLKRTLDPQGILNPGKVLDV